MNIKFIATTIFICSVCTARAQYKKNDIIVGGSWGVMAKPYSGAGTKNSDKLLYNSQLQADVAIALKKNLLLGVRGGFGATSGNTFYSYGQGYGFVSNMNFSGDVYLRKYIPLGKKVSLFGELSVSYSGTRYLLSDFPPQGTFTNTTMKSRVFSLGAAAGISVKVSERVRLELAVNNMASARYGFTYNADNTTPLGWRDSRFQFGPANGLLPNVSLGVKIKLGK